jgi:DNA processing protein
VNASPLPANLPFGTLVACLRLARTEQVGPRQWHRLMALYKTPEAALEALREHPAGRGGKTLTPAPEAEALREVEATLAIGGRFLTLLDAGYPAPLRHVPDAPVVLSVLGDTACLHKASIGIVGARNASAAGLRLAESLSTELVEAGLVVVSGLARGIDTAAHRGALHRRGLTIAAIAGGLNRPYPPENAALQARIAEHGAVITEAPLGTAPLGRHFPRRNRLIAGLALGCVVVEAAPHSGTLITARMACDYGRELFAVPGSPLDPRCRGSNDLIRNGAVLTESAADILPHINSLRAGLPPVWQDALPLLSPRLATPPPAPRAPATEQSVPRPPTRHQVSNAGTAIAEQARDTAPSAYPAGPATPRPRTPAQPDPAPEARGNVPQDILDLLSFTPIAVDDLIRRCQFSASAVLIALTELELSGRIITTAGGHVALAGGQAETRG